MLKDKLGNNPELICIGLLLLLFGATLFPWLLILVVLLSLSVVCLLPFGRCLQLGFFLIPCLDIFLQSSYTSISLATLVYLAIFARYLFSEFLNTRYYLPGVVLTLVVVAFELSHIIYNPVVASSKTVRWFIMFAFVSLLLFDRKKYIPFDQMRYAMLLGVFFSTFYGLIYQNLHPVVLYHSKAIARFAGGAGDPNNFGLYCILLIFFYLPTVPRRPIAAGNFLIVLSLFAAGSLTISRSYFLVLTASLGLYFLFYFRSSFGDMLFRVMTVIAFALVGYLLFSVFGGGEINLDILKRFSGDNLSELTGARSDIVKEYVRLFFQLPLVFILFGAGINGYLGYYNYIFAQQKLFSEVVGPHNTILETIISFGVIGSFILIAYVYVAFRAEKVRTGYPQFYRLAYIPLLVFFSYFFSLQNLAKYSSYFVLLLIICNTYRDES